MTFHNLFPPTRTMLTGTVLIAFTSSAAAHEAWLLTPVEIETLAAAPIPRLFTSHIWLGLAALIGGVLTLLALRAEDILRPLEERLAKALQARLALGPLILRLGLAAMLVLAATGGLPRHGTAPWTEPTYLVPDMQLGLVPGLDWVAGAQIFLALLLVLGFWTRGAGMALILMAGSGPAIFGTPFLGYTPHFAAPGLMLVLAGGGALSLDRWFGVGDLPDPVAALVQPGWRLAQILTGAGFIYLSVAYKLTQPTLIIAILEHGSVPTLGLPLPVVALVMAGVEIVCGALLVLGRLVRPVSLIIIGAITFLAVTLGETPLFHANLYGVMLFLALAGRAAPAPAMRAVFFRRSVA